MKQKIIVLFSALLIAFVFSPVYKANAEPVSFPSFTPDELSSPITIYTKLKDLNIPFVMVTGIAEYNQVPYTLTLLVCGTDTSTVFSIEDGILKFDQNIVFRGISNFNTIDGIVPFKIGSSGERAPKSVIPVTTDIHSALGKYTSYGEWVYTSNTGYYYYNPNGGSLDEFGDNEAIPMNERDMLDLPVGTIRLMYPKNTAHLTIGDDGAELEIMIDGKSGYLNVLPSGFPDIGQAFYAKYLEDAMTKDYAISVNGKTVNSTVGVFNKFGKKEDWAENKFVTFEGGYKISMKELKSGPCTITFGCNVLIPNEQDLYYMEWKSVSVELNVEFQKDLNGDGYDDDTGKKLVNGAVLDNDGDGEADGSYTRPTDENGSDFFSGFVNSIKNVPQYSSEIGRAFTSIFNMFPSPIPQLAVTGIIIMIFVAVISFIRGA